MAVAVCKIVIPEQTAEKIKKKKRKMEEPLKKNYYNESIPTLFSARM